MAKLQKLRTAAYVVVLLLSYTGWAENVEKPFFEKGKFYVVDGHYKKKGDKGIMVLARGTTSEFEFEILNNDDEVYRSDGEMAARVCLTVDKDCYWSCKGKIVKTYRMLLPSGVKYEKTMQNGLTYCPKTLTKN
jgi:hypothetical protein